MFVFDGHVVLDILLIRSYYHVRGASQKVKFRVIAGSPARRRIGMAAHSQANFGGTVLQGRGAPDAN